MTSIVTGAAPQPRPPPFPARPQKRRFGAFSRDVSAASGPYFAPRPPSGGVFCQNQPRS